ncbi:MAG: imidazoleglycerol-phosphate dehydratase, partial [Thermodesulfobacteriota bacterium]|nr:imidazoleglycerol-phosphate dehydratase [Thermodesulfobacteriota bacterium]
MKRSASVQRQTAETQVSVTVLLDGIGTQTISTGIP